MTELGFYHLTATPLEKALPKLLLKILEGGNKAVLLADNEERLNNMNRLLWVFSTNKIIPHGVKKDGFMEDQPVYLTLEEENPNDSDVLLILGGREPEFLNKFSRCIDIFDGNDNNEVEMARERWKKYKAKKGKDTLQLVYWKQDEKGSWQKE